MYRSYEDPYVLERLLERAEMDLSDAIARGDLDDQIAIGEDINDLKHRLAAAWEDDEAEVDGYE